MPTNSLIKVKLLSACIMLAGVGQFVQADTIPEHYQERLIQAKEQLHNGEKEAAYNNLLALEDELAGYPTYDLMFGHAALTVQENTRAVLAFERCLAVSPKMGDCRLGLAQAQIRLGEIQSAKEELTYIQQSAPPEAVANIVEQYLGELSGQKRRSSQLKLWAELGLGYDNNINAAPSSSRIILPGSSIFPGFSYNTSNDESMFADARLGLSYSAPVNDNWDVLMGGRLQGTYNFDADDNSYFDEIIQANAHFGTQATYGKQRIGLLAQLQNYRLSGDSYRDLYGLTGQYSYRFTPNTQVSTFLQYSRLDYDADNMDTDTVTGGASLAHSLMRNRLVVHGGVYAGIEDGAESNAPEYTDNEYFGLRAGATWFWSNALQTSANLMTEQRKYDGDILFIKGEERDDTSLQFNLNSQYQLTQKLSFSADYNWVNNDSNLKTRDYDRQSVRLGVRYDFL